MNDTQLGYSIPDSLYDKLMKLPRATVTEKPRFSYNVTTMSMVDGEAPAPTDDVRDCSLQLYMIANEEDERLLMDMASRAICVILMGSAEESIVDNRSRIKLSMIEKEEEVGEIV